MAILNEFWLFVLVHPSSVPLIGSNLFLDIDLAFEDDNTEFPSECFHCKHQQRTNQRMKMKKKKKNVEALFGTRLPFSINNKGFFFYFHFWTLMICHYQGHFASAMFLFNASKLYFENQLVQVRVYYFLFFWTFSVFVLFLA